MNYSALIVAAGSGTRMGLGYNKVFYKFKNGQTIIEKTVNVFASDPRCKQIILVSSEEDLKEMKHLFNDLVSNYVIGGETRQHSVNNGLACVNQDYVLIHDGARPWVSKEEIDRIITTLETQDACLLCVPVKDTIKKVVDGVIQTTYVRSTLMQAQTPQAFKTTLIQDAYTKAMKENILATDDAQIAELCSSAKVIAVEGSYTNKKATTMEDLTE